MDQTGADPWPEQAYTSAILSRASRMAPPRRPVEDHPPAPAPPSAPRRPPYLPTPTESIVLAAFPALLVFGATYAVLSPASRAAPYDPVMQAHVQDPALAPSYFARKANLFNVIFVKRGWAWVTAGFAAFVLTHPSLAATSASWPGRRRAGAAARWALVTAWWFLVTQWCFGPAIIDRGFRLTGGRCELAELATATVVHGEGTADLGTVATALACKTVGGRWSGGHDISGHVFLLALGSGFLLQEVGWALASARGWDERRVLMSDGTMRGPFPVGGRGQSDRMLGVGGKAALTIVGMSLWMLLMTAIYFHTWFEKLTGLLTALAGLYAVYVVPRFVPALRGVVGLPGMQR